MHAGSDTLLLERERELSALEHVVARVADGAGEVVLVEGPPGVGKTRLVAGARAAARRAGVTVLEARGAELEREFAFGVARQLLEASVLAAQDDDLFAGAAGVARRLFEPGHADPSALEAGFATLHALYWLVVNLSDAAPVLVSVDDAHWADDPSLRFLDYLARRVDGVRVALVLAGRANTDGLWPQVAAQAEAQLLRPAPLSEEAVRALVRGRLGPEASDELCAACHLATHGNPLFLRELLRALDADGGTRSPADVTAVGPAAVGRFVRHRLAALGDDATELARTVAVLGDGTDPALARAVAGTNDVAAAADALVRADVLAPDERLGFVHPIVRAAVYEELGPGERQARHAAAAAALADRGAAPERIAAHVILGGRADADVLAAAAASAAARGAPDTAVGYLRHALEDPRAGPRRAELLTELARFELAAMELLAAGEHLRAALALDAPTEVRVRAAALLARAEGVAGGPSADTAAATIEALAAELRDTDRELSLELGSDLLILSEAAPALRPALPERLDRFTRQAAGDDRYEALAEIHAANAEALGGGGAASVAGRIEAAIARGLPPRALTSTLFVALNALVAVERYETPERFLRAGLELARREGHAARQGLILGQLAVIALARGELADALVDVETGLGLVDTRHTVWLELSAVATVVHVERGDLDAAGESAALGERVDLTRDRLYVDEFLVARGRLEIARGELERGLADLEECGRRLEGLGIRWRCDWRAYALTALAALGHDERAARLADEHLAVVRAVGARGALGRGLRNAGAVLGGERGLALLEEAVTVLERGPARLELAHALYDLGAELGRRRRRREGRELLRAAMELATDCGTRALAERARAELEAGGGRRARLELTGANALTPAERRVCELAAAGELTNRAIAQSLFVTEKTVELHLSNAYRKLGIRSRFQLAEALAP